MRIFSDAAGQPGSAIGTLTSPGVYGSNSVFTASGITLSANTKVSTLVTTLVKAFATPGLVAKVKAPVAAEKLTVTSANRAAITRKNIDGTMTYKAPVTTQIYPGDVIYVRERWF